MKKILLLVCLLQTIGIVAQRNIAIIPAPAKLERHSGIFKLTSKTTIVAATTQDKIAANFFNDYLKKYYDLSLRIVTATSANSITLATHSIVNNTSTTSNEKYILTVSEKNISIVGNGNAGTFYGIQSLIQLLPIPTTLSTTTLNIQCLTIEDEPRFGYRGMHLDVSRHFFPIEYIKKYIDYIALHKMNTFHWHLTDDQGWRIEIKKYPKLTSVGGFRNGTIVGRYPGKGNTNKHYGGFYTQVEVKEIVAYAAKRYITVIPEIEMPGHASAAIAAYPQLSCFPEAATKYPPRTAWNGDTTQKNVQQTWGVFDDVFCPSEFTFNFLQDVLDEVMPLFPSNYIHIGGDECPKVSWKKSAFCQQLIKEKNFKDEHELQSYFIQRIEKYINSKGKQIIGWDEILEGGLAPNATVMSWRGEKGGIEAAKAKHNVIMTPSGWCYFDHSQTKNEDSVTIGNFLPLEKVYNYEPIPKDLSKEEEKYILGAQANVWAEYITNTSKIEYHIFPRMSALSEVLWSKKEQRNWQSFEERLPVQMQRYELWSANYSKAFYDIQATVEPAINENGVLLSF
nr:beta-N-acetylhexosaminidase [Chitinophagaceae bacterium]